MNDESVEFNKDNDGNSNADEVHKFSFDKSNESHSDNQHQDAEMVGENYRSNDDQHSSGECKMLFYLF